MLTGLELFNMGYSYKDEFKVVLFFILKFPLVCSFRIDY